MLLRYPCNPTQDVVSHPGGRCLSRSQGAEPVRGHWSRRKPASHRQSVSVPVGFPQSRSEEHTSELQSQSNLVCRLLLEKKKQNKIEICRDRGVSAAGSTSKKRRMRAPNSGTRTAGIRSCTGGCDHTTPVNATMPTRMAT